MAQNRKGLVLTSFPLWRQANPADRRADPRRDTEQNKVGLAAGAQTPFPLVAEPNLPHARHGQHQRFSRPCFYPLVGCGGVQAGRRRPNPSGAGQVRRSGWSGARKPPKLARGRVMRPKNRQVPTTPGSRVLVASVHHHRTNPPQPRSQSRSRMLRTSTCSSHPYLHGTLRCFCLLRLT
jgi:hypothetical protein